MATAIHIEFEMLCLLILGVIGYQSITNVNQQMERVLFRYLVFGIMFSLALDILWLLVDGRLFPGAIAINQVINALYLAMGTTLDGIWYLYVLESLGYKLTRKQTLLVMTPAIAFAVFDLISIWTGWFFFITPENVYVRGPLFWVETLGALGMMIVPLIHILARLANPKNRPSRHIAVKLLGFYIVPVVGTLATLPFTGMPGTWPCASISIVLIYIDNQDREILRDSLTGLNNRKTLPAAFQDYTHQITPERRLYLFMLDLDKFKRINDTYGHPMGDQALVLAARVLARSMGGVRGIITRYGGDEFLVMAFFDGPESAQAFRKKVQDGFAACNRENNLPYTLAASIGFAEYTPKQGFDEFIQIADEALYKDKQERKHRGAA